MCIRDSFRAVDLHHALGHDPVASVRLPRRHVEWQVSGSQLCDRYVDSGSASDSRVSDLTAGKLTPKLRCRTADVRGRQWSTQTRLPTAEICGREAVLDGCGGGRGTSAASRCVNSSGLITKWPHSVPLDEPLAAGCPPQRNGCATAVLRRQLEKFGLLRPRPAGVPGPSHGTGLQERMHRRRDPVGCLLYTSRCV